jgi:hypothetical protein
MQDAVPPALEPQVPATREPLCGAGCGTALSSRQIARGAKVCSAGCRVRAHRERRKQARLAEIDAAIRTLQALRAEVARE